MAFFVRWRRFFNPQIIRVERWNLEWNLIVVREVESFLQRVRRIEAVAMRETLLHVGQQAVVPGLHGRLDVHHIVIPSN